MSIGRSQPTFFTGTDATEAFEDVGHSDEARALLPDMLVGDFDKSSVRSCRPYTIRYSSLTDSFDSQGLKQYDSKKSTEQKVNNAVEKGSKYVSLPEVGYCSVR